MGNMKGTPLWGLLGRSTLLFSFVLRAQHVRRGTSEKECPSASWEEMNMGTRFQMDSRERGSPNFSTFLTPFLLSLKSFAAWPPLLAEQPSVLSPRQMIAPTEMHVSFLSAKRSLSRVRCAPGTPPVL